MLRPVYLSHIQKDDTKSVSKTENQLRCTKISPNRSTLEARSIQDCPLTRVELESCQRNEEAFSLFELLFLFFNNISYPHHTNRLWAKNNRKVL